MRTVKPGPGHKYGWPAVRLNAEHYRLVAEMRAQGVSLIDVYRALGRRIPYMELRRFAREFGLDARVPPRPYDRHAIEPEVAAFKDEINRRILARELKCRADIIRFLKTQGVVASDQSVRRLVRTL